MGGAAILNRKRLKKYITINTMHWMLDFKKSTAIKDIFQTSRECLNIVYILVNMMENVLKFPTFSRCDSSC